MSQIERKKNPIVSAMKTMSIDEIPYRCFGLPHEKTDRTDWASQTACLGYPFLSCHLDAPPFAECLEWLKRSAKLLLAPGAMSIEARPRS